MYNYCNFAFRNIVPTNYTTEKPLQLRPQSVVVLTDTEVAPRAKSSSSSGRKTVQTGSILASLICVLLILRVLL